MSQSYLSSVCEALEFSGTKQKVLNSIFAILVDAYIDRFILAANANSSALKIKLFEKFGKPHPILFTLTGLVDSKEKSKLLDFAAIFNDHDRAQQLFTKIDHDIETNFTQYAQQAHYNLRVQQGVIQQKKAQLKAVLRAMKSVFGEGTGPWQEECGRLVREFGVSGEFDPNIAIGEIKTADITGENLEEESARQRLRYLNEIFTSLKAKKVTTKPTKTGIFKHIKSLTTSRKD